MLIQSTRPKRAASPIPVIPPKVDKEGFWDELFSGELNEIGIHFTPDQLQSTVEGAHSLGDGLRKTWKDLRAKIDQVFDLDKDQSTFDPEFRKKATEWIITAAKTVGYTAAGVQGAAGVYKLATGIKQKNLGRKLDGIFDLSTAAAVGTTVAGLPMGPLVLGPLAAGMGVVRGGYVATKGFLEGDGRKEIQGTLDATRAASVGLRLANSFSPALGVAGAVLAPIAGGIQATRGYYDLSDGLATENKEKQMRGLTDIVSAAGLTVALTGIGTIPGIAVTALAMGGRLLYQFNDRFEGYCNEKLDDWNDDLKAGVKFVDKVTEPVIKVGRRAIETVFGHTRGEEATGGAEQ